jgi:phosphohistidine phosphatase
MSSTRKTLYLVRHAKSSWKDMSLSDHDRPLNKRGKRSAPDMGQRMARQGHKPELIVSSTAMRAQTTARLIARELEIDDLEIITDRDLYFSGIGGMRSVLEATDDRYQSVMMVGHNPTMTDLMTTLSNTHLYNMPTCAIAIIGFDMASWGDLSATDGVLLGYDTPKGPGSFTT